MRPVQYPNEKIIEAGTRIQDEGRTVTAFAIRKAIGGGDTKRIAQVWYQHVTEATNDESPVPDLPVEVEEAFAAGRERFGDYLRSIATEINKVSNRAADRRVADMTRDLEAVKRQADAEMADSSAMIEELEDKNRDLENKVDQLEEDLGIACRHRDEHKERADKAEAKLSQSGGMEALLKRIEKLEHSSK
ncbi:DNA-binding protein [Marinobacter sp. Arc7-DN-1]|uniref:DNA-binding protein n=1 Tax=Marinobacter sp. Arc7-DN-1 TaxID=2304594 RepID=UPI000E451820|nr:DNA-binding protein [Marinobacter sp. Arc7-DN-1]AXS84544.1 hypothetical protein D0851_16860 [Marinobacter sp. Arc7-DN-1]